MNDDDTPGRDPTVPGPVRLAVRLFVAKIVLTLVDSVLVISHLPSPAEGGHPGARTFGIAVLLTFVLILLLIEVLLLVPLRHGARWARIVITLFTVWDLVWTLSSAGSLVSAAHRGAPPGVATALLSLAIVAFMVVATVLVWLPSTAPHFRTRLVRVPLDQP